MKSKKERKMVDKKILTFFLIAFPTIMIIIVGALFSEWGGIIQTMLALYQFILLKQFLDNYYEVLD